jgi:hypothetical protein
MHLWSVDIVANGIIAIGYLAITLTIAVPLFRRHQFNRNPLATLIALIFFTCSLHRIAFIVGPLVSQSSPTGWSWLFLPDAAGAIAGIAYWVARTRVRDSHIGLSLFRDHEDRERSAREINDNIVQGLTIVNYSLEMGDLVSASRVAFDTLLKAQRMMDDLITSPVVPGDLRREKPVVIA